MTTTSHSDLRDVNREEAKDYACAIYMTACLMETVRAIIGKPIRVTSGFRSEPLNSRVKGSRLSQHCRGEACDWQPIGGSLEEAFEKLVKEVREKRLNVGQLPSDRDWETEWVCQ